MMTANKLEKRLIGIIRLIGIAGIATTKKYAVSAMIAIAPIRNNRLKSFLNGTNRSLIKPLIYIIVRKKNDKSRYEKNMTEFGVIAVLTNTYLSMIAEKLIKISAMKSWMIFLLFINLNGASIL